MMRKRWKRHAMGLLVAGAMATWAGPARAQQADGKPDARLGRAEALLWQGSFKEAEQIASATGANTLGLVLEGRALINLHQHDRAVATFTRYLELARGGALR